MEQRYNIYYAGEVLQGQDPAAVRQRLGTLFKAGEAALDKLFSGTPQLVKRDCDKPTALKYKQAMEQAGAKPLVTAAKPEQQAAPAAPKPQTAAERIAALAAAPDVSYEHPAPAPAAAAPAAQPATGSGESPVSVSPAEGELLRPEERPQVSAVEVDTSGLSAEGSYARLEADRPAPPPAPDTSHLEMGAAGEAIPTLAPQSIPLDPDTSALALSPEGTDFSDCAAPAAVAPPLDLSAMDLAPAGSDVLEEAYRRRETPPPPATDHLSVEE